MNNMYSVVLILYLLCTFWLWLLYSGRPGLADELSRKSRCAIILFLYDIEKLVDIRVYLTLTPEKTEIDFEPQTRNVHNNCILKVTLMLPQLFLFYFKDIHDESRTSPKWKSRTTLRNPKHARPEKRERRPSSDIDVHRAYTGMDREIVEEFISVTMDPKHYSWLNASRAQKWNTWKKMTE